MIARAPVDDGNCIGCRPANAVGLGMRFRTTAGGVECTVEVTARFQGWRGVVHGGVVAMLLDEAMAYAAGAAGVLGMTADLRVRFRNPVPVGAPLTLRGRVLWRRRTVLGVEATLDDGAGAPLASGEGRFVASATIAPGTRFGALDDGRT